jgi:hypothetical protein
MCLKIDHKVTEHELARLRKRKETSVVFFKVFKMSDWKLTPAFQQTDYKNEVHKHGEFRAPAAEVKEQDGYVSAGAYHAYCTEEAAQDLLKFLLGCGVGRVVCRPVTVPVDSIVAYGDEKSSCVAFTKMTVQFEHNLEHV